MTEKRQIVLRREDARRLQYWAKEAGAVPRGSPLCTSEIRCVLEHASIVSLEELDPNVVTLGSIVQIEDRGTREGFIVWLVAPGDESELLEKVAVTSGLGLRLLGRREGDEVTIGGDSERRLRVTKVLYQNRVGR